MSRISGIITPLVTPFNDDGTLDCKSLERLVNFQLENGIHGLFLFGSSGECMALTESQRLEALKVVTSATSGKIPVIVGVMDNSVARVIERAERVAKFNVHGLVVTVPFYHRNSQPEVIDHFAAIHEAVDLPLYAYDVPGLVKTKIEPKTVMTMAEEKIIRGLKDSSGDLSGFRQIIVGTKGNKEFSVFTGSELLVDTAILMGASGAVAGLANVAPREYVELYDMCKSGNWERAVEIQDRLIRLFEIVYVGAKGGGFSAGALSAFKAALVYRGVLKNCKMAAPMRSLDQEGMERVSQILKDVQLAAV
ncbi:MAG: dihydrodipicolinate synthase family protein [Firmicutes bacterium]|nr:dihydrodipicolinate synthase family protein [Bacillota bacterium]